LRKGRVKVTEGEDFRGDEKRVGERALPMRKAKK
jgi:hypothetical protein